MLTAIHRRKKNHKRLQIFRRLQGEKGFTLIELLVVIIIIAILAAIAIPTFLGQRAKAQNSAAKSLLRTAMTAAESAYVDALDFTKIVGATPATPTAGQVGLDTIEPAITFKTGTAGSCASANPSSAKAADNEVEFIGTSENFYELSALSASGKTFGVAVNKSAVNVGTLVPGNNYYVDGQLAKW